MKDDKDTGTGDVRRDHVLAELNRILANERFAKSPSLSRFLKFVVQKSLDNQAHTLKEYSVGIEVFDRGESFDPRIDPIVRVQAGKLRTKLKEYYEGDGALDPLLIDLPKGAYLALFQSRTPVPDSAPSGVEPEAASAVPIEVLTLRRGSRFRLNREWTLAFLIVIAVGMLAFWPKNSSRELRPTRLTFDTGASIRPTVSRDAKWVAYASDRGSKGNYDIWIQPLPSGEAAQLTQHEAEDNYPDFSPDSTRIVFRSWRDGGGIYIISVLGREERRLVQGGYGPRFSPDGARIAYSAQDRHGSSGIFVIPSGGGEPTQIGSAVKSASCPLWSPDGKQVLFVGAATGGGFDWWFAPVSGERAPWPTGLNKLMIAQGLPAVHINMCPGDWIGERVVFTIRKSGIGSLWQVPLSTAGNVTGEVTQLVPGPGLDYPRLSGDRKPRMMVFGSGAAVSHLWGLPIDPRDGKPNGPINRLTQDSSLTLGVDGTVPSLSKDGRLLAFSSQRSGNRDIWVRNLESGQEYPVAANPWPEDSPVFSPDGKRIAYYGFEHKKPAISLADVEMRVTQQLCAECGLPQAWSSADNSILYLTPEYVLWSVSAGTGERRRLLGDPNILVTDASLSPDGRWLAFVIKRKGTDGQKGFVAPLGDELSNENGWIPITQEPFNLVLSWAEQQLLLYYFGSDGNSFRCLWAQPLIPTSHRPNGNPSVVQHFHKVQQSPLGGSSIAVSQDKLVVNLTDTQSNIWMAELP